MKMQMIQRQVQRGACMEFGVSPTEITRALLPQCALSAPRQPVGGQPLHQSDGIPSFQHSVIKQHIGGIGRHRRPLQRNPATLASRAARWLSMPTDTAARACERPFPAPCGPAAAAQGGELLCRFCQQATPVKIALPMPA